MNHASTNERRPTCTVSYRCISCLFIVTGPLFRHATREFTQRHLHTHHATISIPKVRGCSTRTSKMPSLLLDRLGQFFVSIQPDQRFDVRVRKPVEETEARLNLRFNAAQNELSRTRELLEDEKSRSKKWERRAVVANADLVAVRGSADQVDRSGKRIELLQDEKTELEHRVTRLSRMLTVAEEQRGVAIARLAGFSDGVEEVQAENKILKGTLIALEKESESVRERWRTDVEKRNVELREWENKEVDYVNRVKSLQEQLDNVSVEKRVVEEKLSLADAQLLEGDADRCLVTILNVEREKLEERIAEVSQSADMIPGLENEVLEGQRRLKGMSKVLVAMKRKGDELAVHARVKEQYGDSMAQMFSDMKKECERLRRERDEKTAACEAMVDEHAIECAKQNDTIEGMQVELGTKDMELTAYEANLERLRSESDEKNTEIREYFEFYSKLASVMKLEESCQDARPDFRALESTLSDIVTQMSEAEARAVALESKMNALRHEKETSDQTVVRLDAVASQARKSETELREKIDNMQHDNVRLHERGVVLEAEVSSLARSNDENEKRTSEFIAENNALRNELGFAIAASKNLQDERNALRAEINFIQETMISERKEFADQLAERTAEFASLEIELKDARESYRIAAKNFETSHLSLTRRLTSSEQQKEAMEQSFDQKERLADDSASQINELTQKCQRLKQENDGLKQATNMREPGDNDNDILVLREMLVESEKERERLAIEVNDMRTRTGERSLSCSSVSSNEDMARRVQELEATLSEEAKQKEEQQKQLSEVERNHAVLKRQVTDLETTALEKQKEAEKLRGEMASIYSRMRKMACVSLPPGAEELLDDEDDLKRLNEFREASRNAENDSAEREKQNNRRDSRKLPPQRRKTRMGIENKTRFRV